MKKLLVLGVAVGLLASAVKAETYDIAAGGNWTDAATWNPTIAGGPTASDAISVASISAARTVSLNGDDVTKTFPIASLRYNEADGVIIRSLGSGAGGVATRRTLAISGNLVKDGSGTLTLRNPISGSTNYGMLLTVGGGIEVNEGTLTLGGIAGGGNVLLQGATVNGTTTVADGASLRLALAVGGSFLGPFNVNGSLDVNGTATLIIYGLAGTGEVITTDTTTGTKLILFDTAATANFNGNITENATLKFSFSVRGGGTQEFSGVVSLSGDMTVNGGSTLIFSGHANPQGTVNVRGNSMIVFRGPNATYGTAYYNLYQDSTYGLIGLGSGDFARTLGKGAGQIQLNGGNGAMSGFAAFGADRTVTLNGGAEVTYTSPNDQGLPINLIFGHATADAAVILANGIDITSTIDRTMTANRGSAPIDGILAGTLRGSTALIKTGDGTLAMTKNNSYSGIVTVQNGVLLLLEDGNTAGRLVLDGGILGLGNGDMTRALSASSGANISLKRTANAQGPSSGFAAFGADRTVNLGGAGATITWNTTAFADATVLGFSSYNATHTLIFANGIDLSSAERTIHVENGAAEVDGRMTGVLSGTGASALRKTGTGTLCLDNDSNSYADATTVAAGHLGGDGKIPGNLVMAGGGFAAQAGKVLHVAGNVDLSAGTDSVRLIGAAPTARTVVMTYTGSLAGMFDDLSGLPARYTVDYGTAGEIAILPPANGTVIAIR